MLEDELKTGLRRSEAYLFCSDRMTTDPLTDNLFGVGGLSKRLAKEEHDYVASNANSAERNAAEKKIKKFITEEAVSFGKHLSRRGLVWLSIDRPPILATRSAAR
jgi:hypothetical protein